MQICVEQYLHISRAMSNLHAFKLGTCNSLKFCIYLEVIFLAP